MAQPTSKMPSFQQSTAQTIYANLTGKRNADGEKMKPVKRRKFFVQIDRKPEIEAARSQLPVCMHEQEIIEAIHSNDIILVTGATGTGKTTQLPQFLVEDGFGDENSPDFKGIIGVTQPRRVAAVSCASRVAYEMNTTVGELVGYQIRHETKKSHKTKIKFATDGIFLREVEDDLYLRNYSAIIIDEVHERSLNTDLLLSFLSKTVKMRNSRQKEFGKLKVVIMSATLDITGVFSGDDALFPNPPVVKVPSRQYPVTLHFAKKTVDNYVDEAFNKVAKIHKRLPPGGILIFLSGRREVEELSKGLENEFAKNPVTIPDHDGPPVRMRVLPFYALLADHQQKKVFQDFGDGYRKVIIATNVAETSVTIPGISYVVDSGRVKEKVFGQRGQSIMSSFQVVWVSKASAEQRAGRAGRTSPGHCYRLYSSAVYDQQFEEFRKPEILRTPVDAIVLRLRAMGILHVSQFPFPTRPDIFAIDTAQKLLTDLRALHPINQKKQENVETWTDPRYTNDQKDILMGVTKLGRDLARLPIAPRVGCMLLSAEKRNMTLAYACRIAAVITIGTVLDKSKPEFRSAQRMLRNSKSDLLTELAAMCAVEHAGLQQKTQNVEHHNYNTSAMRQLCSSLCIHLKTVVEGLAITKQLETILTDESETDKSPLKPPDSITETHILRSLICGFPDQIARRMTREEAASLGIIPRRQKIAFVLQDREEPAFLESGTSVRLNSNTDFVCFTSLEEIRTPAYRVSQKDEQDDYEESSGDEKEDSDDNREEIDDEKQPDENDQDDGDRRLVLRGATPVLPLWIFSEAQALCEIKRGAEPKELRYDSDQESATELVTVRYGKAKWGLGAMRVPCQDGRGAPALAIALLSGQVRSYLHALKEIGEGAVKNASYRRLSDELAIHKVGCVIRLKESLQQYGDFLTKVIVSCIGRTEKRKIVERRWREGVNRLLKEDDSEDKCGREHDERRSYSDDDEGED